MDVIAAPRELDGVAPGCTAGIEQWRPGKDAAVDEPGGDDRTFLAHRPVDEQVERPGVLSVERPTGGPGHRHPFLTWIRVLSIARRSR